MALAEICGISEADFYKDRQFAPNACIEEVFRQSANFETNELLAVPPFENVRLCADDSQK